MAHLIELVELSADTRSSNGLESQPDNLLFLCYYDDDGDVAIDGLDSWSFADSNRVKEILENGENLTPSGVAFSRFEVIENAMGLDAIYRIPENAIDWIRTWSGIIAYFKD